MTSTVNNEVHSLREFRDSYINPLVNSIYNCLYFINHKTSYQTTNTLKDIIEASDNLDNAVDTYSELFGKLGEESQFRDAVNHMVMNDIVTSLSTHKSSFSDQFKSYTLDKLKESTTGIADYHEYVQSFIDDLAEHFVNNGHCYDIVITRYPDKKLKFDTDDVSYLMSDESSLDIVVDNANFGNSFTDIHGNSWLPCMIYYAHGDYTPDGRGVKDERCVNEGCIGLAIPIDDTNNASINGTKLIFENPVCTSSVEVFSEHIWSNARVIEYGEFYISAKARQSATEKTTDCRRKVYKNMWERSKDIREAANTAFNEFRLGAYKPDLFDDTGRYYVESDERVVNKQSISANTLDSLIQQYQSITFEFINAQQVDTLSWDALSEFVSVVTEPKPSQSTPNTVISELKPTNTVKYNKAVDTYDITDD